MSAVAASFWGSSVGLILALSVSFLAVFVVVTFLFGARARSMRQRKLRTRIGGRDEAKSKAVTETHWMPAGFVGVGQRFAVATGFSAGLDERLEQAGMPILAGEFVALVAVGGLAGAIFGALLLQNIVFVLIVAAAGALLPYLWLARSRAKRQRALTDQLADTLSILSSSLRAGYSFLQALDTVSKEIGEPSATEFQRVVAEIRLGRPVDDALLAMAERVNSDDLKWAVIAINVQRQVGGNLAEILDTVANTIRERAYIRRQVNVLSAEGKISVAILSTLPFAILLYMAIVNPDYVRPLFTTRMGYILLALGGSMIALGIYVMLRMVRIDV